MAFGISVDDTIHFLAKYRQELIASKWKIQRSVYAALRETGVSMFYTSIVFFFGFSVFMSSEFGGTVALGRLDFYDPSFRHARQPYTLAFPLNFTERYRGQ